MVNLILLIQKNRYTNEEERRIYEKKVVMDLAWAALLYVSYVIHDSNQNFPAIIYMCPNINMFNIRLEVFKVFFILLFDEELKRGSHKL